MSTAEQRNTLIMITASRIHSSMTVMNIITQRSMTSLRHISIAITARNMTRIIILRLIITLIKSKPKALITLTLKRIMNQRIIIIVLITTNITAAPIRRLKKNTTRSTASRIIITLTKWTHTRRRIIPSHITHQAKPVQTIRPVSMANTITIIRRRSMKRVIITLTSRRALSITATH